MPLWSRRIKNKKEIDLVLSSSGVRAPCFIGAIEALEKRGYEIKRIAGSSGGAIIASLYALGFSTRDMKALSTQIPYEGFRSFKVKNLLSLSNPSVYSGKELDAYYQQLFGNATLGDFKIDCKIGVVSIVDRQRILLDKESYPSLPVWKAVRMSSTIPFIFPYYSLEGTPVTDGALVNNLLDVFPDAPRPMVGIRPRADHGVKKMVQDVKTYNLFIWNYLKILAEYLLDAVDNAHIPEGEWARTIIIPTREIGGFNFHLTPAQVRKLIDLGFQAAIESTVLE